jgi:hypothetical protein
MLLFPDIAGMDWKACSAEEIILKFRSHMDMMEAYLRNSWLLEIFNILKSGLSSVGKGWFSLSAYSNDPSKLSRLKNLLMIIKLLMQDSLRFLVIRTFEQFLGVLTQRKESKPLISVTVLYEGVLHN